MLSIKRVGLQNGQTISHFSVHLLWTSTYFMNNNRMSTFLLHGGCSWSQTRAVDVLRLWCQLLETAGSLTSRHWDCIPIKQLLEETTVSEEAKELCGCSGICECACACEPGECGGVCAALVTFSLCQPKAVCSCVWCESCMWVVLKAVPCLWLSAWQAMSMSCVYLCVSVAVSGSLPLLEPANWKMAEASFSLSKKSRTLRAPCWTPAAGQEGSDLEQLEPVAILTFLNCL